MELGDSTVQRQMPRYKCHKEVYALRISAIEIMKDGSAQIAPADDGFAPFQTVLGWADRYKGGDDDLGYFVQYEGGYESWSPTAAFKDGYTLIETTG